MSYSTLVDLQKVIPEDTIIQLTDDADPVDTVDTAIVDEMIAQADGEIDLYVGAKYTVPLTTVPDIIRSMSCDIAIYKLYKRRMEEIPETRDNSYTRAVKLLKEIRDGKQPLPIATAPAESFASGVVVTSHFATPTTLGGLEI